LVITNHHHHHQIFHQLLHLVIPKTGLGLIVEDALNNNAMGLPERHSAIWRPLTHDRVGWMESIKGAVI